MDDQDEGAEESIVEVKVNYDYLLSMPINSLTLEKVHSLPLSCLSILIADHRVHLYTHIRAYLLWLSSSGQTFLPHLAQEACGESSMQTETWPQRESFTFK